ncbi:peptidylprolyl isomerase [Sinorhizobium garamanticum]|uniref:Parvulin-like PPIase n=1 Tax=Sinorhizobium garamanticum TaxID=680247 RepID=A0ABY8D6H6_9HYPH|nr:peptidylprolyl isomerase [Sinorhizobium garamanticum]WEX86474.1 peptidylprolyl isomerase [Sinorhizobium garamanticum]
MKLLREPLLHFAVAGAGLFAVYAWIGGSGAEQATGMDEVQIGEGELRWVGETWARQWQREPSREELRGLLLDLLKEELLAREARELGLDRDDTVVRRRLAQKMTFLIEDTARVAEPQESELRAFYDAHQASFSRAGRISFEHVFFDRGKRRDAAADARRVLVNLAESDALAADEGDRLLIESDIRDADRDAVAAQFGQAFADAVFTLSSGEWSGPIESAYGLHLVRVYEATPGEVPPFEDVKAEVLDRWRNEQRRLVQERYFAELFGKYDIVADERIEALVGPLPGNVEPGDVRPTDMGLAR